MPEARIPLAQAAVYVATAPKSNASFLAVDQAFETVKNQPQASVPAHLRDAHYKSAQKLGHGTGYRYAHDYKGHYVKQQYLPDGMTEMQFYKPTENGYEQQILKYLKKLKNQEE